jgi:hypothetical protein
MWRGSVFSVTFLHQAIDAVQTRDRRFLEGSQAWHMCRSGENGSSRTVSSDRDHGPTAGRRRQSKSRTA